MSAVHPVDDSGGLLTGPPATRRDKDEPRKNEAVTEANVDDDTCADESNPGKETAKADDGLDDMEEPLCPKGGCSCGELLDRFSLSFVVHMAFA